MLTAFCVFRKRRKVTTPPKQKFIKKYILHIWRSYFYIDGFNFYRSWQPKGIITRQLDEKSDWFDQSALVPNADGNLYKNICGRDHFPGKGKQNILTNVNRRCLIIRAIIYWKSVDELCGHILADVNIAIAILEDILRVCDAVLISADNIAHD
jgi:hypothetical protein